MENHFPLEVVCQVLVVSFANSFGNYLTSLGGAKDGANPNPCPAGGEVGAPASASASTDAEERSAVLSHEEDRDRNSINPQVCPNESKKSLSVAPQLQQCRNSSVADKGTSKAHEGEGPKDG